MRSSAGELRKTPRWARAARRAVTAGRTAVWLARDREDEEPAQGFRALLYHRVAGERDPLAVPPGRFAEQMGYLASAGYRVVTVGEAVEQLERAPSGRLVALSFDDGYRDFADAALPILRRHGFRASVYVATGLIDGADPLSWYAGDRRPELLDWEAIRALDAADEVEFEAHSVSHRDLLRLSDADARREVVSSKSELERRLGRPVAGFSYPAGRYGDRELTFVREAGYRYAVTCDPGLNTIAADVHALRRIEVLGTDRLLDFRARLRGGHDEPMPLRWAYRRLRY